MKEKIKLALKDKDFSELLRGSGLSFFLRFGGLMSGYLLTLIIANLFGADGLGDYVLSITVLRLFTLLSKLGLDTTSIKFIVSFASQNKWTSIFKFRNKVVFILIISSIFFSFLLYTLSQPIADLINAQVKYIKLNSFFILPMSFFMLHYQSLRGLKRIAEFSFFYRMSQSLFTVVSVLIIYYFIQDNEVPIYAYLVSLFACLCFSIFVF